MWLNLFDCTGGYGPRELLVVIHGFPVAPNDVFLGYTCGLLAQSDKKATCAPMCGLGGMIFSLNSVNCFVLMLYFYPCAHFQA